MQCDHWSVNRDSESGVMDRLGLRHIGDIVPQVLQRYAAASSDEQETTPGLPTWSGTWLEAHAV